MIYCQIGTPSQIRTVKTSPFERDDFTNLSKGAWWQQVELNHRHIDFQSTALPTELCRLIYKPESVFLLYFLASCTPLDILQTDSNFSQKYNLLYKHIGSVSRYYYPSHTIAAQVIKDNTLLKTTNLMIRPGSLPRPSFNAPITAERMAVAI